MAAEGGVAPELLESVFHLIYICKNQYGEDILPQKWPYLSSQYFEYELKKELEEVFDLYLLYVFQNDKSRDVKHKDYQRDFKNICCKEGNSLSNTVFCMMREAQWIQYQQKTKPER